MRSNFQLLLLLCIIAISSHAQTDQSPSLNIGDPAPPLLVRRWLKGAPIQKFEKGNVYVLEFWATWCKPCRAAMPHLSALAREYKDRVTIIGVNIMEMKANTLDKVKVFVDSMGHRMDYHVAAEDSNFMVAGWLEASGELVKGIPRTFVVNAEGKLAWIGHPKDLDEVLPKILNNTWDIKGALSKRKMDRYLAKLDEDAHYELMKYAANPQKPGDRGRPDSALLFISEIVKNEPELKYAPRIAYQTFSSLLKTDPHKAYEYGKVLLVTPSYEDPACFIIIDVVNLHIDRLKLPTEIYLLVAEAYQVQINQIPYSEIVDISRLYNKMAEWYLRANEKSKAIEAQQKAIEALKGKELQ